jgi:hypothetical protein
MRITPWSALLCFFLITACGCDKKPHELAPLIQPTVWEWSQENVTIDQIVFLPDGQSLIVERRRSWPDDETARKALRQEAKTKPRIQDPEIVQIDLAKKKVKHLAWGEGLELSPDGKRVAFLHSAKPLTGKQVWDEGVYDQAVLQELNLETGKTTDLVKVDRGYPARPRYSPNGNRILFLEKAAVDGVIPETTGYKVWENGTTTEVPGGPAGPPEDAQWFGNEIVVQLQGKDGDFNYRLGNQELPGYTRVIGLKDGDGLAQSQGRNGQWVRLDSQGKVKEKLGSWPKDFFPQAVSDSGQMMAWSVDISRENLYLGPPGVGGREIFESPNDVISGAVFGPTENRIAFLTRVVNSDLTDVHDLIQITEIPDSLNPDDA